MPKFGKLFGYEGNHVAMEITNDSLMLFALGVLLGVFVVVLVTGLAGRRNAASRAAETARFLTEKQVLQERFEQEQKEAQHWYTEHEKLQVASQREQQHLAEKIELLQQSEVRLQKEFENLANRIFEQKTAALEQRQEKSLASTLNPLQKQLEGFRQQIAQQFSDETKQRAGLQQQISSLRELNQQMSAEAEALTRALKGDTRQQG